MSRAESTGIQPLRLPRRLLTAALLALVVVYAVWFGHAFRSTAALAIFGLPPLGLAIAQWRGARTAGFWAAVLALLWFSHGVMVAWTRPAEAGYAWAELLLAVIVVVSASWNGLRMRYAKKR